MSRNDWQIRESGDGLDRWIAELRDLATPGNDFKDRLDRIIDRTTERMRAGVPRRTGALAASGRWTSRMGAGLYEAEIRFGDGLDYGLYQLGPHRNGEFPWDVAWKVAQTEIADEFLTEFPGMNGGDL